jgi:hypothetical protein
MFKRTFWQFHLSWQPRWGWRLRMGINATPSPHIDDGRVHHHLVPFCSRGHSQGPYPWSAPSDLESTLLKHFCARPNAVTQCCLLPTSLMLSVRSSNQPLGASPAAHPLMQPPQFDNLRDLSLI